MLKGSIMKNINIVKGLFLMVMLATANVYAVIIEGSFSGKVRSFTNGAPEIDIAGYWDNVSEGSLASGSFWYDTDKAPQNTSDFTTSSFYQSYTDNWMGSNFSIDGKTYDISALPIINNHVLPNEGVWLFNFEPAIDDSAQERFYLFDNITTGELGGFASIGLMVELSSFEKPLLNGLGITQEFDWCDVGDTTYFGQAYFSFGTVTSQERKEATTWIDLSEFHLNIRDKVNAPEPAPLLLLLLGVFMLFIKHKINFVKRAKI